TYTVSATDDDGTPLSDTEIVTVTITGTNDAPVITDGPDSVALTETDAGLTSSGTLTGSDADLTDNVTAAVDSIAVSGTGASSVPVSLTNAVLKSFLSVTPTALLDNTQTTATLNWDFNSGNEAFDFLATGETLVLTYTVSATDDDGTPLSDTETITVTITGTNDVPVTAADTATATEAGGIGNGMAGTDPVGNVLTNDSDVDHGDTRLVTGVASGVVGVASGNVGNSVAGLYGSMSIAADGSYSYTVDNNNATVQALRSSADTLTDMFTYTIQDAGGLDSSNQITVTIQGANDAPHDITSTALVVDENAPIGTTVGTTSGHDVDSLTNGETLTYSLTDDAGGRFAIDSTTGEITVANGTLLNYESATSHLITVRITDQAGLAYQESLTITVTDVDEFDVTTPADVDATSNHVAEDAAVGTSVGITTFSTDSDGTTNVITYSLDDDAGGLFRIDSATGIVTVNAPLDYETSVSHTIVVRATSQDTSFALQSFTIDIGDVDEFDVTAPVDNNPAADAVNENSAAGTTVGITAHAVDGDGTTNSVTYSLTDDAGGRFAIDSVTGIITVADGTLLNHEAAASHNITVRATSADGSTSETVFTINVLDVNEPPVQNLSSGFNLTENSSPGTSVGQLTAS
ncbi:MAG: cadherin domain-containing protein, partial [Planctomycetaceae bacterium]|nr:cadherin domain-containing protein [Planctomycetaceae bacterium]